MWLLEEKKFDWGMFNNYNNNNNCLSSKYDINIIITICQNRLLMSVAIVNQI